MIELTVSKTSDSPSVFSISPKSIELGGKQASGVDFLRVSIPPDWKGKTVRITFVHAANNQKVAVILPETGIIKLTSDITSCNGDIVIDAAGTDDYAAYSADCRYTVYDHPDAGSNGQVITPSEYQQFVAETKGYSDSAAGSATAAQSSETNAAESSKSASNSATAAESAASAAQAVNIVNPQNWTDDQKSTARTNINAIPYSGATSDIDIGSHNFKANGFIGSGTDGSINIISPEITNVGKNKYIGFLSSPSTGLMMQNQTYVWNGTSYDSSNGLFIGASAGLYNTGTSSNGFGYAALYRNTGTSSNGFGYAALYSNTGTSSIGIGNNTLYSNTGSFSIGIGNNTLQYNQKNSNIAIGNSAYSNFLENSTSDKSIDYTMVDMVNNRITISNHGFGTAGSFINIKYQSTTGTPIGGLFTGGIYQVKIIDSDTLEFLTNGRGISLTSQGTGSHTFRAQFAYGNTITIGNGISPNKDNQAVIGDPSILEFILGGTLVAGKDYLKIASPKTPASSTDVGITGQICYDSNYLYVCVASNTWKRVVLTTW